MDGGKKRVLVRSLEESRSYSVEGLVGGEGVGGFVSTVFTCKTEEVCI